MNRHTSLDKQPLVLETTDDDSSGKENCSTRGERDLNRILVDSSDDKILNKLKTRRIVPKRSAKKNSQCILNPGSDDSFESLLSFVKTPKSAQRKVSVSRQNWAKTILVDSSSDDDSALKTKKTLSCQAATSKPILKPLQNSQQFRVLHSDGDDGNNGADDKIPITSSTNAASVHPTPKGRFLNPAHSVRTAVPTSAPLKTSVSRQPIVSSDSDCSFEEFLNRVKTPKAQPKNVSVSGSKDSLKNFIVDSSDDDDFVFEPKKPSATKAATSKPILKPLQNSQQFRVLHSDDGNNGADDKIPITSSTNAASVHPTPKGRFFNPAHSVRTAVPTSAPLKTSVSRQPIVSSDSDCSFEEFLNRVKTPKAQPKNVSVSGSKDSLKNFIVDSSDDDDFVFEPKKPSATKGSTKAKLSEVTPKFERQLLSNYDSPVFLTDDDDDDDDDDDGVAITSTWRTRHTKPSAVTPCSTAAPIPSSAPPKTTCTKIKTWSSSEEEEVESLLDRLKKNFRLHSDNKCTPKNKPEPKQKPCMSDPSMKGNRPKARLEKGGPTASPPVQPPKFQSAGMSEPRATSGSRTAACKTPGCFLQSLSDPTSVHCRSFKQNKEELTSKLYRLYNSSVFEGKLPANMSVSWCNKMRKTAGFCITGQERATGQRYARIRLSVKVCDSADRLRDTLVHEMCHAAPWLVHGVRDGHGPIWKMFARKAMLAHPELPMVSRCHSYDIKYKFQYQCSRCKNIIGRHSKSLDTQRFVCAICTGQLVLLTPSNSRGPTPFAIYVKENYKSVRQQLAGQSHGDVMRKLSSDFASKTRLSES
ncbi:hypothetical protein ACEWY4_027328 [Coilia grayii]|uniref:SprT-like domain-containing protein n=1 Tax=Coilia grayii TaxID=363190 RepID=A0ABD1ISJ5_9TELE